MDPEHRAELLRQIKGNPLQGTDRLAERLGIPREEVEQMIKILLADDALRRDGERLIVVESATSKASGDRPIP